MAKLPSTIYKQIYDRQRKLYKDGTRNGTISLADCHAIFAAAGYKESTANKWLLNWAVSRVLMFEKEKGGYYCVRLGEFYDKSPSDCLDHGKVWLPVKECKIKVDMDGYHAGKLKYGDDPIKAQGWLF